MKTQSRKKTIVATVQIGVSRQVVIPKKFCDQLALTRGDSLRIEIRRNRLVLTPSALIDKRLNEGIEDLKNGRVYGPFRSVKEMIGSLRTGEPKAATTDRKNPPGPE